MIREEEESFLRTLATGITLLEGVIEQTKQAGRTVVDGTKAFTLFDTYGFPPRPHRTHLLRSRLTVDEAAFNAEMEQQKQRARTPPPSKPPTG